MSDFCLVVTSRGRPDNWKRLLDAIEVTTTGDLDVWLVLDSDDPTVLQYTSEVGTISARINLMAWVGPRKGHIGSLNEWCVKAAKRSHFKIVGQMGDDHLPRTKGWDEQITKALTTPGIAYGNDLFQSANLPTAVFMSSEIIRATGKFAPEGLWHLYADNYWRDLGLNAGCLRYLPDVILEHLHPHAGKSEMDATYEESIASDIDLKDAATWEAYQRDEFADDVAKVRAIL